MGLQERSKRKCPHRGDVPSVRMLAVYGVVQDFGVITFYVSFEVSSRLIDMLLSPLPLLIAEHKFLYFSCGGLW